MKKSPFKTEFSERIFRLRYAQGPNDTWEELARRVVEDVCGRRWGTEPLAFLSTDEQKRLISYITEMKFIPGGRYLYYSSRPAHFFNNCGAGDTKLLTRTGWVTFRDAADKEVELLSPVDGQFKRCVVHRHGIQEVYKYTFKPVRGSSSVEYTAKFTEDHKWFLKNGKYTTDLRVGDVVPANGFSLDTDDLAFAHGFVFGDGNSNGQLLLCGDKIDKHLERLSKVARSVTYPAFAVGRPCLYFPEGRFGAWKKLPETTDANYVASFIEGWIAADGHAERLLASVNRDNLLWFREHAAFAGIVLTGVLRKQTRDVTIGNKVYKNHELFIQNFQRGAKFLGFKVVAKQYAGNEEVFCPFEPEFNRIVVDHNMVTGNCFLLRAEEDTREEWASLAQRSTACLMSGGGIGVDYSCIRPNGRVLKRTGGIASGPIPLMKIVNEIGRNVMQGGSRRSAIYASLNWQHEDINEFLTVKDWSEDVRKLKAADFNFPATLDMTNVSINWDTKFLTDYNNDGTVPQLWYESVRRMMKTGEPGHSYNFYENENETLRNACAEVTSEDDSDCCNLGSVHLANIANLEELRDVTRLAGKFLVCGTLRGDLPIPGAYKVREKNRRIGVGLMGIHEWMLQRNLQYGLNPELETWLQTWKEASEEGANGICDRLYLNRPVKYRAIAPTGTVGILASTSTGLEPLFAVAYKRRYLVSGTKWKHEYVVDATAKRMIEEYGIDPDQIETAYTLALDPERRIAFQAGVQKYVDHSIASTLNLPAWGTEHNNDGKVKDMADLLLKYCGDLRGITCYPNGARGGQPLTVVPYADAVSRTGVVFDEDEEKACAGGVCGL